MPHVDKRTGEIVLRIVYDGLPEAGKTTNIKQLGRRVALQRRGKVESPGTTGRRTAFFDWMDFEGGYIDGRPVRCQIVTVPGQPALLRRRRYLLRAADAVIFVADSRRELAEPNRRAFVLLRQALVRSESAVAAPVVLQANKQDLPGALEPGTLRAVMAVPKEVPVFAAEAEAQVGVMQTFLLSVRLATDRIHELIQLGELSGDGELAGNPLELFNALRALEEGEEKPAEREGAATTAEKKRSESATASHSPMSAPEVPASGPSLEAKGSGANDAGACPEVPLAQDVPAGCFWPPVRGRAILAAINEHGCRRADDSVAWSPVGAFEFRCLEDWLIHTSRRWLFADQNAARNQLIRTVRSYQTSGRMIPDGRTLFIAEDGGGWRLWMISPALQTLHTGIRRALLGSDSNEIVKALERVQKAAVKFGQGAENSRGFPGLTHVAVAGDAVYDMTVPGVESTEPRSPVDSVAEVKTLVVELMSEDADVGRRYREASILLERSGRL